MAKKNQKNVHFNETEMARELKEKYKIRLSSPIGFFVEDVYRTISELEKNLESTSSLAEELKEKNESLAQELSSAKNALKNLQLEMSLSTSGAFVKPEKTEKAKEVKVVTTEQSSKKENKFKILN